MSKILVRHKVSGLVYALWQNEGYFWLTTNDGRGSSGSGQKLYCETLEEVLKENPVLEEIDA